MIQWGREEDVFVNRCEKSLTFDYGVEGDEFLGMSRNFSMVDDV